MSTMIQCPKIAPTTEVVFLLNFVRGKSARSSNISWLIDNKMVNELYARYYISLITRDALRGHTVSKNGSISFFFFFFFFFSFLVATNVYINLFIKLSPLLLGMYCPDCLQQKKANLNGKGTQSSLPV